MLNYLVCATHRSGSNLLCQSLWHTDLCGYPQEFFSPTRAEKIATEHDLQVDPASDYAGYVAGLIERRATENGVFGGKIMWAHLAPLVDLVGREGEVTPDVLARMFPNLRYLWMRRDDKLLQAISMWKAKQTRIYNSLQEGEREAAGEVKFDFDEIAKAKKRFEQEDAQWGAYFSDNAIDPVEIHYEEFAKDHEGGAVAILRAFEIAVPDSFKARPITYRKLADSTNEEWRERFLSMEAKS